MAVSGDAAEALALDALAWLIGEEDLLGVFMGSTGAGPEDMRGRAGDPDFLGSVLDFLLMDDAWVIRFCDATDTPYDRVMPARAALPGGERMHWT